MKYFFQKFQKAIFILTMVSAPSLHAQTDEPSTEVGMYLFMTSINGTSQLGNVTADIDVSFKTLAENLDFGLMGFVKHRRGKWSFTGDLFFANIGTSGNIAYSPTTTISVDSTIKQLWAGAYVGYQIYEQERGGRTLTVDLLGGLRFNSLDYTLGASAIGQGNVTAATRLRDENWVDGVIGVQGSYNFGNGWAANGWVDVGKGKDSSSYQVMATASYTFANNVKVFGGFRTYNIDYSTNSGPNFFAIDQTSSGPILGASYSF